MKTVRLYSVFALPFGDPDSVAIVKDVSILVAKSALLDYRDRMRAHGFAVRQSKCECDNLPYLQVKNKKTGVLVAEYWIRETA